MEEGLLPFLLGIARFLLLVGHPPRGLFKRLQRLRDALAGQLDRVGRHQLEQPLQLGLGLARACRVQQPARVEPALQRALQAAEVDAQRRLTQEPRELVGPPLDQRLRHRRHLREQLRNLFQLDFIELFGCERVEERALQAFDEVFGAGKVELEQPIEDGRVLPALDQRGPQRAAKGSPILEPDQNRRLRRVGHLGRRNAQAVLPQESGKIFEPLVHFGTP